MPTSNGKLGFSFSKSEVEEMVREKVRAKCGTLPGQIDVTFFVETSAEDGGDLGSAKAVLSLKGSMTR